MEQDTTAQFPPAAEIQPGEDRPLHVRLAYNEDLHNVLISPLKQMIIDADSHIAQREDAWNTVDEHMRLYVNLRKGHRRGDHTYDDDAREIPFERDQYAISSTYVNVMTRTDHVFTMLNQADPFIHLEARESGDFRGARIHEAALRYDAEQSRNPMQLWQLALDTTRYQLGAWLLTWEEEMREVLDTEALAAAGLSMESLRAMERVDPIAAADLRASATRKKMVRQWNNWKALDPRQLLPDPAFPITSQQNGRFIGFWEITNWLDLDTHRLVDGTGGFINVDDARTTTLPHSRRGDARQTTTGAFNDQDSAKDRYPNLEIAHIFWRIIPFDYALSESREPEIWWFSVANRRVIVRAHRMPYGHNRFPIFIGEAEPDAHSVFTPSVAEQNIGYQNLMNWLATSHVTSIKRFVNDGAIVNDNLINLVDFLNPEPGRMIRLAKKGKMLHEAGRMTIDQMYSQPKLQDVTGAHLETMMRFFEQSQTMMATPPPIVGAALPTKRTLGEIENVQAMASLRLGVVAQLLDEQVIGPMARCAVQNLQEFSSVQRVVRLGGRLVEQLMQTGEPIDPRNPLATISPDDFQGEYDYIPRTPTMAKDPSRSAALWGMVLQTLLQFGPQAMQPDPQGNVINMHAVFNEYLRALGITYFDQFRMPAPQPPPPPPDVTDPNVAAQSRPEVMDPVRVEEMRRQGDLATPAEIMGNM